MKLQDSYLLLDTQGRVMAEVAKHYNWKDDAELKEYTDFILHEPVQWMKGYPVKYAEGSQFSKPKTALVKLMKHSDVIAAYGEEYTSKVRDAVWHAFKSFKEKHAEEPTLDIVEDLEALEIASVHSTKLHKKDRSDVLAAALRAFIEAEKDAHPGLAAVSLTLLDAFLDA